MSGVFIKRIDEPDFGCEGAPDNKPICDKVLFVVGKSEVVLEIPEKIVWETGIDEGVTILEEMFEKLKNSAINQ